MNKKTIIAVGGGEIGRVKFLPDGTAYQTEIETTQIDKFIIKAFIPSAAIPSSFEIKIFIRILPSQRGILLYNTTP